MDKSESENPFTMLQKLVAENPNQITILEAEIDIKVQMAYFKASNRARRKKNLPPKEELMQELNELQTPLKRRKELLTLLATFSDVKAFRAIEAFQANAAPDIHAWAVLAYQESRMMLSADLLGNIPIIIATGLGGKNGKLRYCLGFCSRQQPFTPFQIQIVRSECTFSFGELGIELEYFGWEERAVSLTLLIPIELDIRHIFYQTIQNINLFGDFLMETFIITNMRKISLHQINKEVDKMNEEQFDNEELYEE